MALLLSGGRGGIPGDPVGRGSDPAEAAASPPHSHRRERGEGSGQPLPVAVDPCSRSDRMRGWASPPYRSQGGRRDLVAVGIKGDSPCNILFNNLVYIVGGL